MKKLLALLLFVSSFAFGGTVTGQITTATGGPVAHATLSLSPTQPFIVAGTSIVVSSPVACYTDGSGNVVGEPDAQVAPVVTTNTASGTLPAGTYSVKFTYYDGSGESVGSFETVILLSATGTLNVAPPVLQPATATGWKIYISSSTGAETLQSTQVGFSTTYQQSSALAAGSALPSSNTSACKLFFNDQGSPTVGYNAILIQASGSTVFKEKWRLLGGASGTVNLSNGTPLWDGIVQYPLAIVATPAGNAPQSIAGPLNLGPFPLFAGQLTDTGLASGQIPRANSSGQLIPSGLTDDGTTVSMTENMKSFNFNSVLSVDGVKYTTLAGCYADLPSTGGICMVPPNYTETLAATLTMSKNNAGFFFMGPATITMGSNQIVISQGIGGSFIAGQTILGGTGTGGSLTAPGLKFAYTGTGTAIPVGGGSNPTSAVRLENFFVDLTGAGSAAIGVDLINVHGGFTVKNVFVNGKGGAITQAGLLLDDGGGAGGTWDGIVEGNWFANLGTGLGCNGNIQETAFINNIFFNGATGSTGFNINCAGGGNGGYVFGNTISGFTTAYNFTANATAGWELHANGNSNTTDIAFASGSSNNNIYWDNSQTGPIVTDSSGATSNNHIYVAGYNGLLNEQPAAAAITGTAADLTYYTYTLPARALPPGKCLDIEAWGNHSTGTASTVYKVFFGSSVYVSNTSTGAGQVYFRVHVCNNQGTITAQHGGTFVVVPNSTIATLSFAGLTSSENSANPIVIKITFNVAATDQFTPEDFSVRMSN